MASNAWKPSQIKVSWTPAKRRSYWDLVCAGEPPAGEAGIAPQLAASSSESSEAFAPVDGVASSGAGSGAGSRGDSSSSAEWSAAPVHYFVMGPRPRWEEAQAWPPPVLAAQPLELSLGGESSSGAESVGAAASCEVPEGQTGTLSETGPSAAPGALLRWRHEVELWKCPKV